MKGTYYKIRKGGKTFIVKHNLRLVADVFGVSYDALKKTMAKDKKFTCRKTGTEVSEYILAEDYIEIVN